MQRRRVTVELPHTLLATMLAETFQRYPAETGGLLLGHQSQNLLVIDEAIGPGPHAQHTTFSFDPDQPWQEREVARLWNEHGGQIDYLGDWHTHPRGRANLSRDDISCLKLIQRADAARAPHPLMLVLAIDQHAQIRPCAWLFARQRPHPVRILITPPLD